MKNKLLEFYFGSIGDEDRLVVERELLTDEELLVDYLDLKRSIEAAAAIPTQPSRAVRDRLKLRVSKKNAVISLSIGAAMAAGILLFLFLRDLSPTTQDYRPPDMNGVLFDSSGEPSPSSGVL